MQSSPWVKPNIRKLWRILIVTTTFKTWLFSGYCSLTYPNFTDGNVKYIREGFEKRVSWGSPVKLLIVDCSVVWRRPHQVREQTVRLQLWSRAEVHLAGGDWEETLQHWLSILQVNNMKISWYYLNFIVSVTHLPSTLPTEVSACVTLENSFVQNMTLPRDQRKEPRFKVREDQSLVKAYNKSLKFIWDIYHLLNGF